jgi:hypothetical protein
MALFVNKCKIFRSISRPIEKYVRIPNYSTADQAIPDKPKGVLVEQKNGDKSEKISRAMRMFLEKAIKHGKSLKKDRSY